ncbi:MAG: Hsp20/alpha crystallin family protein [Chloroflexi bacterium]|nr:Hsp20/alpha crystallin family protein [Chloroflexota bacterium]MBI5703364.1 Hsp20/alpha crystallin family protein [Chloroflexota bacterium]
MALTDLIPWKKNGNRIAVRRRRGADTLLGLRNQMNRLFDEFFERSFGIAPFFGEYDLTGDFIPRIDVSETDREITVVAELPGMEPEDINLTLSRNILTISGEKRSEVEEEDRHFYRVERSYGSFCRSIPLPDEVDEDKIDATFKRGVLKVKLPKTAEARKRGRLIPVKTK